MRVFSTSTASLRTVRKVGFYPTERVARRIAEQIGKVLELSPVQVSFGSSFLLGWANDNVRKYGFMGLTYGWDGLTPAEARVFEELRTWWVCDDVEAFHKKAFFAVNLNTGSSLVIVAGETLTLESIDFDSTGKQITAWRPAEELDVIQLIK